jgi:hypothetical protein
MENKVNKELVSLCLLIWTLGVNAQATLTVKDFSIAPGETKQVYIEMDNMVEIRALQVLLSLPEGVKLAARPSVVAKRCGMIIRGNGQSVAATKSLSYKVRDNGNCMIVVNATDGVPFSGQEGAIIALTLKADEEARECSGQLILQDMELVYADGATSVCPQDVVCKVDICREVTNIEKLMVAKAGCTVNVHDLNGTLLKRDVSVSQLLEVLNSGIYVIEGVKVCVK